jgi:hypothetical protein
MVPAIGNLGYAPGSNLEAIFIVLQILILGKILIPPDQA